MVENTIHNYLGKNLIESTSELILKENNIKNIKNNLII